MATRGKQIPTKKQQPVRTMAAYGTREELSKTVRAPSPVSVNAEDYVFKMIPIPLDNDYNSGNYTADIESPVENCPLHHRCRRTACPVDMDEPKKPWKKTDVDDCKRRKREEYLFSLFRRAMGVSKLHRDPQKETCLADTLYDLAFFACSLSVTYAVRSIRRNSPRTIARKLATGLSVTVLLSVVLACLHVSNVCTPPSDYMNHKPFVEYYVHGRGMGHASRSIAIVSKLNEAGVDVRLFIPRLSFWEAHQPRLTSPSSGVTKAVQITSVTPDETFFESIRHIFRRITSDCHASVQEGRYPDLVISDGDMPGMLRAKLGGIPNAAIAHGQLFHIAEKPDFVTEDGHLNKAWGREKLKNFAASYFSQWTIATHLCYLESSVSKGSVVQTPLRQEVLAMARARQLAPGSFYHIPRSEEVEKLLIKEYALKTRRRLVICYFRDQNGQSIVDALLASGFDVLLMVDAVSRDNKPTMISSSNDPLAPRLIQVADRQLFMPLMHVADGVAASAGSQLMSECIHSKIPLLALYKQEDDEQHLNVELSRQCQQTQVFGTSFESFESNFGDPTKAFLQDLPANNDDIVVSEEHFEGFQDAVRSSQMSEMYYSFLEGQQDNPSAVDDGLTGAEGGLPGAVDIIRDILQELHES